MQTREFCNYDREIFDIPLISISYSTLCNCCFRFLFFCFTLFVILLLLLRYFLLLFTEISVWKIFLRCVRCVSATTTCFTLHLSNVLWIETEWNTAAAPAQQKGTHWARARVQARETSERDSVRERVRERACSLASKSGNEWRVRHNTCNK